MRRCGSRLSALGCHLSGDSGDGTHAERGIGDTVLPVAVHVSDSFEGGNIRVLDATRADDILLEIKPDAACVKEAGRLWYQYFYFRASGVRGRDCAFRITNAAGALAGHGGWEPVADDDDDLTRMKWNLVDWARGTEDREPSAGFRHKHEQFMAMMLESVESVTGRRIDVRTVARCLRVHGGITGVGRFRNSTSGAPDPSANCTLDDVAPRTLNSTTGIRTGGTAQPQCRQGEYSKVEIEFEMTEATESGEYRLVYAGDRLPAVGAEPIAFEGASRSFTVVNCVLNPELPRCVGVN